MMTLYIASVTLAFMLLFSSSAAAQGIPCQPTKDVMENLRKTHGERIIFSAASVRGHILHVWVNPKGGQWTATVDLPDGRSCLVDTGPQHKIFDKPKKGQAL